MLPVGDVIPPRRAPAVTAAVLGVSLVVFLLQQWLGAAGSRHLQQTFGVVPARPAATAVLTSLALHASWMQLGLNAVMLWVFGATLEDRLGRVRFVALLAGSGAAAALLHVSLQRGDIAPLVGTTGVVAGVLGGYFTLFPRSRVLVFGFAPVRVRFDALEVPGVYLLAFWFVAHAAAGAFGVAWLVSGGLNVWAHVAMLAGGALATLLLGGRSSRTRYWTDE